MTTATTEKRYSFASATRLGESLGKIGGNDVYAANATVQGFLARDPEARTLQDGRKVLNMSVALNNTGKKITGALGMTEKADETLWIRASLFDTDNVPAATRAEKVLKKGMLVTLNGLIKPEEYNGKIQFNMNVNDFKISWSSEKGKTVGGEYSYVSARKANKEGHAIVSFEGFIGTEPETRQTGNGDVLSFSVALNKVGNKLNFPLGIEAEKQDVTWIQVNVWDNENGYSLKSRAEKILKKGVGIVGHGLMTARQGEKGVFYNLNLSDFEIVKGLNEKNAKTETFDESSVPVDDDVPF